MPKGQAKLTKLESFSRSQPVEIQPASTEMEMDGEMMMNGGPGGMNGYGPATGDGTKPRVSIQPPPVAPKRTKKRKGVPDEKKEGPTSLFLLSETNIIRRLTKFLIEWPPFEYTVLLTIIANCVVLAVERPLPNGDKTELARELVSSVR